ncbi:Haloacid dehalogenase-like hydrolase domain-containing protein 3 [Coemansia javaensis]|uniref:Haloacid dehalogenase-like hydrolase domain-containing protein 3 n=1 Tax=Coemansia javaensis TaxID=2761396 RepID=A0A9W8HE06_9FUNG|nr:Haloacid dehalogenase-like hydrolase domain-containing protein 3 [Coemansia javaensis]
MARRLGNVRLVTFDLFNTLYTPRDAVELTYARPLRRLGIQVDDAQVRRAFGQALAHMRAQHPNYGHGRMSSREWWRQVVSRTWHNAGVPRERLDSAELRAAREELIDGFGLATAYRMYDEVPRVLGYLRRRGVKMGVVSNMDESGEMALGHLGIRGYFDFVLRSAVAGVEKPDPRIFEMALNAAAVPPYDALHVGDSEPMDYDAARRLGMEARLVTRGIDPARLAAHPDKHIADLGALLDLV